MGEAELREVIGAGGGTGVTSGENTPTGAKKSIVSMQEKQRTTEQQNVIWNSKFRSGTERALHKAGAREIGRAQDTDWIKAKEAQFRDWGDIKRAETGRSKKGAKYTA